MNKIKEEWVDIIGWEDYYEISNLGRIKSKKRVVDSKCGKLRVVKSTILSLFVNSCGYTGVLLSKKGKQRKTTTLHRLLALHFIPNPLSLAEVNHKDTNKKNNRLSNLEWVTKAENIRHAKANGLYKNNWRNSVASIEKQKIKIVQYSLSWDKIKEWESIRAAARELKCSHSQIQFCLKGKKGISQVHGYRFKYSTENE